ncbi:hypothetical protein TSOC_006509 [Tetrabaena socialis]|uniref:TATA element modulatory factor 1 TATA binding domain-containing protein n=1 Tax=Tetrabaena socialis TaxID=47790 RepID=A0A2J8A3H3_9CHLO|nr:hypothetical protein TSOC_006509 [Tetrabaena socialis]|eukprot:PNH07056.1 hypothetical protein TSOC_006509 [Tetrabaena socialis]
MFDNPFLFSGTDFPLAPLAPRPGNRSGSSGSSGSTTPPTVGPALGHDRADGGTPHALRAPGVLVDEAVGVVSEVPATPPSRGGGSSSVGPFGSASAGVLRLGLGEEGWSPVALPAAARSQDGAVSDAGSVWSTHSGSSSSNNGASISASNNSLMSLTRVLAGLVVGTPAPAAASQSVKAEVEEHVLRTQLSVALELLGEREEALEELRLELEELRTVYKEHVAMLAGQAGGNAGRTVRRTLLAAKAWEVPEEPGHGKEGAATADAHAH